MNLKSEVAPKGLQFKPMDFIISGKFATILTVISYPKFINPGFLANLTNISGVKVVAKHIPIEFSTLQNMLNKNSTIRYKKGQKKTGRLILPVKILH